MKFEEFVEKAKEYMEQQLGKDVKLEIQTVRKNNGGCGHFLGPLILRYPHLSCCYKSLALSVLNWTQPSEGKLNSFFCIPMDIFIENFDKLLDSNISP